jgi:RNA:NAD 2'-phosphotransferase (TPT1/KptA family)
MNEISNFFGLKSVDSLRVIGKWVEDRYNLKVINTQDYGRYAMKEFKIDKK